jgi:bifunctional enzyme CysN/CysC
VENIRRVVEAAKLKVDTGLVVLVSFISPYRAERRMARESFAPDEFIEVFVDRLRRHNGVGARPRGRQPG